MEGKLRGIVSMEQHLQKLSNPKRTQVSFFPCHMSLLEHLNRGDWMQIEADLQSTADILIGCSSMHDTIRHRS